MFLDNKYTRIYFSIINNVKNRPVCGYTEDHHIVPKCMGGSDYEYNLVELSFKEHFICHRLLVKMTSGEIKRKLSYALWKMANSKNKISSLQYNKAKIIGALAIKEYFIGVPKSETHKINMRGERPHVNQTGIHNNNFKGWYITPWGTFDSPPAASKAAPFDIPATTIITYCKLNRPIRKKNKYNIPIGVPLKDLGYDFIERGI